MRVSKKQIPQPTIEERLKAIREPQRNHVGNVVTPVSEETIQSWVKMMVEYVEVSEKCKNEFGKRSTGSEVKLSKVQYDDLHQRTNELEKRLSDFRTKVLTETGFYLKWAI